MEFSRTQIKNPDESDTEEDNAPLGQRSSFEPVFGLIRRAPSFSSTSTYVAVQRIFLGCTGAESPFGSGYPGGAEWEKTTNPGRGPRIFRMLDFPGNFPGSRMRHPRSREIPRGIPRRIIKLPGNATPKNIPGNGCHSQKSWRRAGINGRFPHSAAGANFPPRREYFRRLINRGGLAGYSVASFIRYTEDLRLR